MGLIGVHRKLQFEVCNYLEPRARPQEEREVGKAGVNSASMAFHWPSLTRRIKPSFFFLSNSAIVAGEWGFPSRLYLIEPSVY